MMLTPTVHIHLAVSVLVHKVYEFLGLVMGEGLPVLLQYTLQLCNGMARYTACDY
ncbi:hypothetical protein DPMN_069438 [Dreissena polymorpha]|uniref:Uncharacterized protein n=1 Tax=Dreissena polymorpha TaxID=45954 RepID=A0A9D3Z148_DREPO|nr:hypothetical protein DPMN_069438 [Dreissena polymorpha]